MFHVGQKVVRIGKRFPGSPMFRNASFSRPEVGEICIIKTINVWPDYTLLTFVEHDNSHLATNGWEPGFDSRGFRPVIERKTETGMAILREILNRESVEERKPVKARD